MQNLLAELVPLDKPISASISPFKRDELVELKKAGLNRVGIAMDGATPEIFDRIKGSDAGNVFTWDNHMEALENAVSVFGNEVSTHLIIGIGETDRDVADFIQTMHDNGIYPALFAFTPLKGIGLDLPQPPLERYRTLQAVQYLITNNKIHTSDFKFSDGKLAGEGSWLEVVDRLAFQTSGCPGCNRPYYNERVLGPLYNYPKELTGIEFNNAVEDVRRYLND